MINQILLTLGLAVLGYGCLTFQTTLVRKAGLIAFMAATFVIFHALSGSYVVGVIGVLLWFCLPWVELLTRVRGMDLPLDKPLRRRIPPEDDFPFLADATEEIEATEAFELIDDWGYDWQGTEHFFRLFYAPEAKVQVAVCMIREETLLHAYVKLVSRSSAGLVYTTWNYPYSASLKLSPEHRLQWDRTSDSFEELLNSHLEFVDRKLGSEETIIAQDAESFQHSLQEDQRRIVAHNMALGVLRESGEGCCRYTWRGLVFLWAQLVKDMVRLH